MRAGELLIKMAERGERKKKGGNQRSSNTVLLGLKDLGLTKTESHRWQAIARLPADKREAVIAGKGQAKVAR